MAPRVKICCIDSPEEAARAIAAGADAVGLVHDDLAGLGIKPVDELAAIALTVPPPISVWLLTGLTDLDGLVRLVDRVRADTIQLVNPVPPPLIGGLRRECKRLRVVQAVHVTGERALLQARLAAMVADAILLDSKVEADGEELLGATGQTHDWSISARIVEGIDKPVWLAGGLKPGNVAEAVRRVRPFGLDLCTGVRVAGRLDEARLAAFLEGARA